MKTLKFLIILVASVGLIGCNNKGDEFLPLAVSPTLIGNGNLYGNGKENIAKQNLVISSKEAWTELMVKMNSVNNETGHFAETNIDFSSFILLAVFDEVKGNGGYAINISGILESQRNLAVTIQYLSPKGGVYSVMTQPYYIVKIPKTEKIITFN